MKYDNLLPKNQLEEEQNKLKALIEQVALEAIDVNQ